MFAVPESRIGLFVDVGMMFHLHKVPEQVALAMLLACERVKGERVKLLELSTHYIGSSGVAGVQDKIMSLKMEKNMEELNYKVSQLLKAEEQQIS